MASTSTTSETTETSLSTTTETTETSLSTTTESSLSTTTETSESTTSVSTSSSSELGEPFSYKWLMGTTEILSARRSNMKTKYYGDEDDVSQPVRGWVGGTQMLFEVTNASSYPRHRGTAIIQGVLIDA